MSKTLFRFVKQVASLAQKLTDIAVMQLSHPADQIASQLPWPPADIDEITAVDESDDPVHYHVSFDDRRTDPPAENSLLTWSVESTNYPLP